jgi:hypothetical protein
MRRSLILAAALAVAASSLQATPLIWRSAPTLKPLSFEAYLGMNYMQTAKSYDWTAGEWKALEDSKKTSVIKLFPAVLFCPVNNLELGLLAPVFSKTKGENNSFGLTDVWIKARYRVLSGKVLPLQATLSAAAVLPAADETADPPLGDKSTDFALGLIVMSRKVANMTFHARGGYWLNGSYTTTTEEVETTTEVGNMFEWLVKGVYVFNSRSNVWLTVAGTHQAGAETTVGGVTTTGRPTERLTPWIGAVFKPLSVLKLAVRPKIGVPLEFGSRGGSLQPWEAAIDFWVTLP